MVGLWCQVRQEMFNFKIKTILHEAGLSNTCYLYKSCSVHSSSCHGCRSGPRNCSITCQPPSLQGGIWSCRNNKSELRDFDKCFYSCSTKLIPTTCKAGQWDVSANHLTCPCKELPPENEFLTCDSNLNEDQSYPGETTCSLTCNHSEQTTCFNGGWTKDMSKISCPGIIYFSTWLMIGLAVVGLLLIFAAVAVYIFTCSCLPIDKVS